MLFAVNVTAVLPVTPSNVGVFQFAVMTVLTGVYGVPAAAALGYGIILQAVEIATAVAFGLPALIGEGLSWRDVRMRALAATPVELSPRGRSAVGPLSRALAEAARADSRPTSRSSGSGLSIEGAAAWRGLRHREARMRSVACEEGRFRRAALHV